MEKSKVNLSESDVLFDEYSDGFVVQTAQLFPPGYIEGLREERFKNSQSRVKTEYHRCASVPQVLVDRWMREGYDVMKEPIKKTLAKLKAEGFDDFITSDKV